jgi:hypothetical protein
LDFKATLEIVVIEDIPINRFDKPMNKLAKTERDLGGVPSSGQTYDYNALDRNRKVTSTNTLKTTHKAKTPSLFVEGRRNGKGVLDRTLRDWAKQRSKRTDYDPTIAAG